MPLALANASTTDAGTATGRPVAVINQQLVDTWRSPRACPIRRGSCADRRSAPCLRGMVRGGFDQQGHPASALRSGIALQVGDHAGIAVHVPLGQFKGGERLDTRFMKQRYQRIVAKMATIVHVRDANAQRMAMNDRGVGKNQAEPVPSLILVVVGRRSRMPGYVVCAYPFSRAMARWAMSRRQMTPPPSGLSSTPW